MYVESIKGWMLRCKGGWILRERRLTQAFLYLSIFFFKKTNKDEKEDKKNRKRIRILERVVAQRGDEKNKVEAVGKWVRKRKI